MNKKPRRIPISKERIEKIKNKEKYKEVYVFDPDFLEEYKEQIISSFSDVTFKERLRKNMDKICEFIICDRVKNGLSRLVCSGDTIQMDIQFADITENSFTIKPGCEYIETIFVHELLHAASQKQRPLNGITEYVRNEEGKVINRKSVGLNEGITQLLAEKITKKTVSKEIDSYFYNKEIVGLLGESLGFNLVIDSYFGDENKLKNAINSLANNPNYYDDFNKDLDTINKLQTTIRRIKNGSIVSKDPDTLLKMETILESQQQQLVESLYANVILPSVNKQPEEKRQEKLTLILAKYEDLLKPVSKYSIDKEVDFEEQIVKIRNDIKENGINFSKIKDQLSSMIESRKISKKQAEAIFDTIDSFYQENETKLTTEPSNLDPSLKKQLTEMVEILDRLTKIQDLDKTGTIRESIENHKQIMRERFKMIPNLDLEIEKIRGAKNKKQEVDYLKEALEAGKKGAIEKLIKPKIEEKEEPKKEDKTEEKKTKIHPNLEDKYVIDQITGQVYNQENKSIYEKAITITKATGKIVDLEDDVLVNLRNKAISKYSKKLDERQPSPALVARYGDKWKEVLLEAYSSGFNTGIREVMHKAAQIGITERNVVIENLKKGKIIPENKEEISNEEIDFIREETEVILEKDGTEIVINKTTGNKILDERTKEIALSLEHAKNTTNEERKTQELLEETKTTSNQPIKGIVTEKDLASVLDNLQEASLEDVKEHLNLYNSEPIRLDDGTYYHPFNDPVTAGKLNQRYKDLTGQDHPRYVKQAPTIINSLLKDEEKLVNSGAYQPEYFDQVRIFKADLEERHKEIFQSEKTNNDSVHK